MTMLGIFAGLAGLFFVLERVLPRRPQQVLRRGWFVDALYVPVHYLLRVFVSFVLAGLVTRAGQAVLPGVIPVLAGWPVWFQAIVVIVVLDFVFYVTHRLKHRWHWWWRLHETHHSSEELDFLASVRFHPLEKLLDRIIYLLPLTVIGPSEPALLIWSAVDVFFGMMNHSNTRLAPRAAALRFRRPVDAPLASRQGPGATRTATSATTCRSSTGSSAPPTYRRAAG